MAIHGIVSTYFGDYEYDIGKSLNWTRYFVDDVYVMDVNVSGSNRQFVLNWDYSFSYTKSSFYNKPFFGSTSNAANWRKEAFTRASAAWNYGNDDWVLFIDGTECLNVFHSQPVEVNVIEASTDILALPEFPNGGVVTFKTDSPHGAVTGNVFEIQFANLLEGTEIYNLDGRYEIIDVPSSTTLSVYRTSGIFADIDMTGLESPLPVGFITKEPPGFLNLDYFQSWLNYEIDSATALGKSLISLDAWALVRSDPPTETLYTSKRFNPVSNQWIEKDWKAVQSEKSYLSIGNLVRLAKVSALSNPSFDWTVLDQPSPSSPDAYEAENLSLISYAYCRWADSPSKMTQSSDPAAPNYVAGDYIDPYLRPVLKQDDVGYICRQLISTVRPIPGLPVLDADWSDPDPIDQKPLAPNGSLKFETVLYPVQSIINGQLVDISYRKYGGSPAYVNVFRNNVREGLWYTKQGIPPKTTGISQISVSGNTAIATTTKPHNITNGSIIAIYGTDASFDGEYVVSAVTNNSISFQMATESGYTNTGTYSSAYAVTRPASFGSVRWDYVSSTIPDLNLSKTIKTAIANNLAR